MARRQSRVLALRALFAMEVGRQGMDEALRQALAGEGESFAAYGRVLVAGVVREQPRIDELIQRFSRGWSLPRLAVVDRCLLRIACYELLCEPSIPQSAIVAEAVELASIYSTEDAPRFINGLLARIAVEAGRPLAERAQADAGEEDGQDGSDH